MGIERLAIKANRLMADENVCKWTGASTASLASRAPLRRASGHSQCRAAAENATRLALVTQDEPALRKLAKGEVHDVPARIIRRLAALGLADDSPEGRLTSAGLAIYRTRPIGRWK